MKSRLKVFTYGKLPSIYNNIFVFVIFLFYFTRFSSLDPEVHHDGVMMAAAVAVSEGRIPNRDVFAQYGPLAPILQGWWIRLTEPSLISIRNFTAILLASTAIVLVILLSRFTNKFMSLLITATWAASYPFFILPMNLPWSSVITTLFSLLILLLILNILNSEVASSRFYFMTIAASFLGCVSIFGRIHMILTFFSLAFFGNCIKVRELKYLYLKIWAITSALTLSGIIALMSAVGALSPYVNQSILWASSRYVGKGAGAVRENLMEQLLLLLFPILSFTFYFVHKLTTTDRNSKFNRILITLLILTLAPISIIQVEHKSYLNPKYAIVSFAQNFTNLIGYLSASIFVYWLVVAIFRKKMTSLRFALGLFGVSILSQLYPLHDILHLYWITPVLIILTAMWIDTDRSVFDESKLASLKLVSLSLLSVNLILSAYNFSIQRVEFPAGSVLHEMKAKTEVYTAIKETIDAVNKVSGSGEIEFNCMDGMYAVSGGKYLPAGSSFVNWGPASPRIATSKYVLACNLSKSEVTEIIGRYKAEAIISIDNKQSNVLYQRSQERGN